MSDEYMRYSGDMVGPYRIRQAIGAGCEGTVFLATDVRDRSRCTVKLLRGRNMVGDAAHTAQHLQRFAAIGSVKRFREWGVLERQSGVGRRPWLAWEYVEGHTVARLVAEGRVHDPLDLLCRICEALLPVHRAGLSIGDFDRGRNLLIQTKTRLVKFCDLDAGTPLQDAPGQAEDMDEMLRLARAMWRRLGESPSDRVCSALSRLSRADRVLDRLLTLQGFG